MKAYERLAPLGAWTQNAFARDENRYCVNPDSPSAVQWCAIGALRSCYDPFSLEYAEAHHKVLARLTAKGFTGSIQAWNDSPYRKHKEVVMLLKEVDV
jgi:hypothetical protein